jgi:hypothetical protein
MRVIGNEDPERVAAESRSTSLVVAVEIPSFEADV